LSLVMSWSTVCQRLPSRFGPALHQRSRSRQKKPRKKKPRGDRDGGIPGALADRPEREGDEGAGGDDEGDVAAESGGESIGNEGEDEAPESPAEGADAMEDAADESADGEEIPPEFEALGSEDEGGDDPWQQDVDAVHRAAQFLGLCPQEGSDVSEEDDDIEVDPVADDGSRELAAPVGDDDGIPDDGAPASPAAAENVPPPLPPPPPAADRGIPAHVPRAARRPNFQQAIHPTWSGYVKLSQTRGHDNMDG
jgi:hypothetical protein